MENCEIIKSCLSCDKNVNLLMDLGYQPLANNFHDKNCEYDRNTLYENKSLAFTVMFAKVINNQIIN